MLFETFRTTEKNTLFTMAAYCGNSDLEQASKSIQVIFRVDRRLDETLAATDSTKIRDLINNYFQLAKTKEIEKIEEFLDATFTKFGESPPYDRRDFERALMLEQLQFASLSDYDFKIENLKIEVMGEFAIATFVIQVTGMIVDDYSFRGTAINNKTRATVVLLKDNAGRWKMVHQHLSKLAG
jgi:ketosteroid isomerase-like protein